MRWLRAGLRGLYLSGAAIVVGIVFGTAHDARDCAQCQSPLSAALVFGAIWLATVMWFECVAVKTGLEECDEGFVIRRNFGSSTVRLDQIDRFGHTAGAISTVYVARTDGRKIAVPGLVEGRHVVWHDGETNHIVAVLNDRLEARRAPSFGCGA